MNYQETYSYGDSSESRGQQTKRRTRTRSRGSGHEMNMRDDSRGRFQSETTIIRSASSHSHAPINAVSSSRGEGELVLHAARQQNQPQHASIRNNHHYPANLDYSPTRQRTTSRHLWQKRRRERAIDKDREEKMTLRRLPSEVSASSSSQMSTASTLVSRFLPSKPPFDMAAKMQNENAPPEGTQTQQQTDRQKLTAVDFARNAPQAGYLFKKGARIAEYKRRFFVLQPSTYLYYFLSETDSVPRGCVDIEKECVEFVMRDEFPDGRCRFELHLGGGDDDNEQSQTLCLEARSPEICREWETALQSYKFSNLQARASGLEQECNSLQSRIHEMERTLETYRLVEKDRDGALQEARMWKNKYRDLDAALAVLTRVVSSRGTTSASMSNMNADSTNRDTAAENSEPDNEQISLEKKTVCNMPLHASSFEEQDKVKDARRTATCANENYKMNRDTQRVFESDPDSHPGSPVKPNHHNQPSNELLMSLADQLLSKDQQLLGSIVLPDSNFGALSNACQTLKENLGLMVQETEHLQQDMDSVEEDRQSLSKKMQKAEKLITKLWEENCSLRESSTKLKKERKLLAKEVGRLSAKEQKSKHETKPKGLGSPEKRLLQELERDLEALSCKYRGGGVASAGRSTLQCRGQTFRSDADILPMQAVTLPTLHHRAEESLQNTVSSSTDSRSTSTTTTSFGQASSALDGFYNEKTLIAKNPTNSATQIDEIRRSNSLINDEDDDDTEDESDNGTHNLEDKENLEEKENTSSPVAPKDLPSEVVPASHQSVQRSPLHPRALSLEDLSISQDHEVPTAKKNNTSDERVGASCLHSVKSTQEEDSLTAEVGSSSSSLAASLRTYSHSDEKMSEDQILSHNQVVQNALDFLEPETLRKSCDSSCDDATQQTKSESSRVVKNVLELLEAEALRESSCSVSNGVVEDESKTDTTDELTCISLKDHSRATARFECPLSKPNGHNPASSTEQASTHMDGRVYHLTFYSRKIGIQFQKVPAPVRRYGRLNNVISPESTVSQETSTKLKSVAWLNEQLRKGRGGLGERQAKDSTADDIDSLCHVASPQDAVLVCGLQGFDDGANHVRPRIGARLVAFDGISLEVGHWTFEAVRQGIQARDRPLTLSFRNDRLDQAQLALLSQGVAELGGPDEYRSPPKVTQECTLQPYRENWFHEATGPTPIFWQPATRSNNGSQSRRSMSSLSTDFQSQLGFSHHRQTPEDIEDAYYESFNDDGGSNGFPSAVPPLVANIFSGFVSRERGTNHQHQQPHYLRRDQSSYHSDEGFRQTLHEFESGLL